MTAVCNYLRAANKRFSAGDPNAHNSVGRALESLVEYHDQRNRAGYPDDIEHRAFVAEVTAALTRMPRPLRVALYYFDSFIECAHEVDSWWVCQRASAAQFLQDDHAAAIPDKESDPGPWESL